VRSIVRALTNFNPPLPEAWKMALSTIAVLRLFQRLHIDWLEYLRPIRSGVPVLLFRTDEPRAPGVPTDLGWSKRVVSSAAANCGQ
jgi:hypothetical protein